MLKSGYTLVEMVVAMGIAALLMTMGVGAFVTARDQQIANDTASKLRSDIRKTQSSALSTEGSCPAGKPKMWALEIGTSGANFKYLCVDAVTGDGLWVNGETVSYSQGVTASFKNEAGASFTGPLTLVFSSPFGNFYQFRGTGNLTGGQETGSASMSWEPIGLTAPFTDDARITLTYKTRTFSVVVDGISGGAVVE